MSSPSEFTDMAESMHDVMSLDGDVDKLHVFYDRWAATYDADVDVDYGMPGNVVGVLEAGLASLANGEEVNRSIRVLDAGCGTGLVGAHLSAAGFTDLHGVDLSEEMVRHAAERGVYASLEGGIDLSISAPEHLVKSADAVTVGGVFTVGHIPPSALSVMASMVRPGGVLAISTRAAYLDGTDFADVVDERVGAGELRLLVRHHDRSYTMDSNGDFWAFEVT